MNNLHTRTCLLHPKEKAVSYSGHVHLITDPNIIVTAGHCKICSRLDFSADYVTGCAGCYGSMDGLR